MRGINFLIVRHFITVLTRCLHRTVSSRPTFLDSTTAKIMNSPRLYSSHKRVLPWTSNMQSLSPYHISTVQHVWISATVLKNETSHKAAQKPKAFTRCRASPWQCSFIWDSQTTKRVQGGACFCLQSSGTGGLTVGRAQARTPSPSCPDRVLPVQNRFIFSAWPNWQQNACVERKPIQDWLQCITS